MKTLCGEREGLGMKLLLLLFNTVYCVEMIVVSN